MLFALPPHSSGLDPAVTAAWIAAGVSLLTLLGTVAMQYIGIRRVSRDTTGIVGEQLDVQREQLNRTLAEERLRTLNERFATAADRLGSDRPAAVRLAAVYAMAGLADDWAENRQTCVDVLCAYLRMPYKADPGDHSDAEEQLAYRASREVRHTVIRVIKAHLRDGVAVSWQGLNLDFTGVVFDGGDFGSAKFTGGTVYFTGAKFSGGTVYFGGAEFSGGEVRFGSAKFSGGTVYFTGAKFSGGEVRFGGAEFSGGEVRFTGAKFSGGEVAFGGAMFSGGTVYFGGAEFSGGTVGFSRAEFSGGVVDFSNARDWSVPPEFPWTGTPPPGVKLPQKQHQSLA